jgi:peptidoglycan/xylan/chitin deacetylase (PgdA/CDA1 family)
MSAVAGAPASELPPFDAEHYLYERYHGTGGGRSPLLSLYYGIKPALPRPLQLALRRAYASRQAAREFPAWPLEPILVSRQEAELRAAVRASDDAVVPMLNYWPNRKRSACVLTHDVEGPRGIANIERVLELENRYGFVSSWNFVAEWYDIPDGTFEMITDGGGEIGLHGIKHDGRLFQSRGHFEADLPKIREYAAAWEVDGFRSPATGRNAEWIHELPVRYDSSFPDSDPFEPQPGGCCSIFPFNFGPVVELPITLVQDHTLFAILRERSPRLWIYKSNWIELHHGLINLITHPDYLTNPRLLEVYAEFLAHLRTLQDCWHALPREVARWWRTRDWFVRYGGEQGPWTVGPDERGATVALVSLGPYGELVLET